MSDLNRWPAFISRMYQTQAGWWLWQCGCGDEARVAKKEYSVALDNAQHHWRRKHRGGA